MRLSDIKRDSAAIEGGQWVGSKHGTPIPAMGDLSLRVRGAENSDWRALQSKLTSAIPRGKIVGGVIAQDEQDRVISLCLKNTCLLDWEGIEGADGAAVPYSKEQAEFLLTDPDMRDFRNAVLWAANQVGHNINEALKVDAKN
jgi:hypothetical protein